MTLIKEKIEQARQILREYQIDCWLTFVRETQITPDPALQFLVDGDLTWHSALIVSQAGPAIAIVGAYDRKSVEDTGAYDEVIGYVQSIRPHLLKTITKLDPKSIAVNYSEDSEVCDGLTHGMFLTLNKMLSEIGFHDRIVSAEKIVSALRQRKTRWEVDRIRAAVEATEKIFDAVGKFIRPGRSEEEIAEFVRGEMSSAQLQPAWDPRMCPAVFTGPDTAEAHYGPTSRRVEPGHVVSMDFGVKVDGYCADLQRSWYVAEKKGASVPSDVQAGFDTIVEAIETARRCLKPGVKGIEVDRAARRVLADRGYDEFPHALGHQVGRFAHDGSALLGPEWEKYGNKPFEPIEAGMVFTLEPRLTVPGKGIVTVEEMVLVSEGSADYLSSPQQKLVLIES
ncbi:MAG TPA: Xaa-Pro peptidase family protein [Acidobacteriota bacterium]|nr:Xaa-Pro peptidase family protein [Acidobacteriota bacterium]